LYKKWGKALKLLSADPGYPSLQTHEIEPLSRRYGMKVWQSYLENKTSGAMRMYWVYGPDQKDITIIGLEPHPEDKKNGAYDRISLSDLSKKSYCISSGSKIIINVKETKDKLWSYRL